MFTPSYRITAAITRALMDIEACRQAVLALPIDVAMLKSLRDTARIAATHYSTMIEGNRLTEPQVREVLAGASFPGRERDEAEVRNYYRALEWVESRAGRSGLLLEGDVKRLHGLSFAGRNRASPYRQQQNVIRESRRGRASGRRRGCRTAVGAAVGSSVASWVASWWGAGPRAQIVAGLSPADSSGQRVGPEGRPRRGSSLARPLNPRDRAWAQP